VTHLFGESKLKIILIVSFWHSIEIHFLYSKVVVTQNRWIVSCGRRHSCSRGANLILPASNYIKTGPYSKIWILNNMVLKMLINNILLFQSLSGQVDDKKRTILTDTYHHGHPNLYSRRGLECLARDVPNIYIFYYYY